MLDKCIFFYFLPIFSVNQLFGNKFQKTKYKTLIFSAKNFWTHKMFFFILFVFFYHFLLKATSIFFSMFSFYKTSFQLHTFLVFLTKKKINFLDVFIFLCFKFRSNLKLFLNSAFYFWNLILKPLSFKYGINTFFFLF